MEEKDKKKTVIGRLLEEDEKTEDKTKIYEGERKQTRIQQIEEEIERECFERAEKARRNRIRIERSERMYEGKPKTIDNVVKFNSSDAFISILESIGFEVPSKKEVKVNILL